MKKKSTHLFRLLPHSFKKWGFILFLLSVVLILISFEPSMNLYFNISIAQKVLFSTSMASLFIIIISKEKIEDELSQILKARSLSVAFIIVVVMSIISPYSDLLFKINDSLLQSSQVLMMVMMGIYFIFYYFYKKDV